MTHFPWQTPPPQHENSFTRAAAEGCTVARPDGPSCGTQDTPYLSGHTGRRCERHKPVDPYAEENEHDCA